MSPTSLRSAVRSRAGAATTNRPSLGATLATVLRPVVMMLAKAVADVPLTGRSPARSFRDFIGEPLMDMRLAVLLALFTFGYLRGFSRQRGSVLAGES